MKTEDPLGNASYSTFDDKFNLTRITDATGQSQTFAYDGKGNLIRAVDQLGNATQFAYGGPFNQLLSFTDARGNTTSYAYDPAGNLLTTTYPDHGVEQLTYDALGDATSLTNRRGQPISYDHNAAGQVTRETFPDGTHNDFTYDARGNLTSAIDADGVTTFDHDAADRLTKVTYPSGRFLEYGYDAGGRRTQLVTHDNPTDPGFVTNYVYDATGRLSGLTDGSGGQIVTYTYDAAGRLVRKDNGNGTYTTNEFDPAGQLLHLVNYARDGSVNSRFDYTYDSLGRRVSMGTLDGLWVYTYDAIGQLTHAVFTSINPLIANQYLTYVYDALGNRIRTIENVATTEYVTNNLNQYTSVGDAKLSYDADGNLISEIGSVENATYAFDVQNRLVSVVTPAGTWTYEYDALGSRIATVQNGQRTEYLLDPTGLVDVVGEYDGTGSLLARYSRGLGLVSRIDVAAAADFYDFDAVGSTAGTSGETGEFPSKFSYLPFGEQFVAAAEDTNSFGFIGQLGVGEDESGLSFMRARYYDAAIGRFIGPDPIGLLGRSTNLYDYCGNDPVRIADPSGLQANASGSKSTDDTEGQYIDKLYKDRDTWATRRNETLQSFLGYLFSGMKAGLDVARQSPGALRSVQKAGEAFDPRLFTLPLAHSRIFANLAAVQCVF